MKILLTGFDRFGDLANNPSQAIVEDIGRRAEELGLSELTTEVLPVEYAEAERRMVELIRTIRPGLTVCLGVAAGAEAIRLERVALNLDDTPMADNTGVARAGRLIRPDAPVAYWSTLPIEKMASALQRRGIPVSISNHAGAYLCNHVFYVARHEVERLRLDAPCGFIHVPDMVEPARPRSKSAPGLPLGTMVEAIEICLAVAQVHAAD